MIIDVYVRVSLGAKTCFCSSLSIYITRRNKDEVFEIISIDLYEKKEENDLIKNVRISNS
jgi:hypothetical protein